MILHDSNAFVLLHSYIYFVHFIFLACCIIVVSSLRMVPRPGYGLKSSTLPTRNGYVSTSCRLDNFF